MQAGVTHVRIPALISVGQEFRVENNPHLDQVEVPSLREVGGRILFSNNAALDAIQMETLYAARDSITIVEASIASVRLQSLVIVGGPLSEVSGSVDITGSAVAAAMVFGNIRIASDSVQLVDLSSLAVVRGSVSVLAVPRLENLVVPSIGIVDGDISVTNVGLLLLPVGGLVSVPVVLESTWFRIPPLSAGVALLKCLTARLVLFIFVIILIQRFLTGACASVIDSNFVSCTATWFEIWSWRMSAGSGEDGAEMTDRETGSRVQIPTTYCLEARGT